MRMLLAASALALATFAGPALVQAQSPAPAGATPATPYSMTVDQRGTYQTWPAPRRTTYDAWPATYQEYYWTLTPSQQEGWWALNDQQRAQIYGMTPEQRTTTWASIEQQIAAQHGGATPATPASPNGPGVAATPATPAVPADSPAASTLPPTTPTTTSNAVPPPPADAMNKTYPVCTHKGQDSCQNPGEGGAPGRSRARNVKHSRS